jgi:serine/threonine-protein kinase
MAQIFAAVHPLIGKRVAIKVLNPQLRRDSVMKQRFLREARAVNQISHPGIIDIFLVGELPDGRPYSVMEQLSGRDLKTWLAENGRPSVGRAFDILISLSDALIATHAQGYVHRDLKSDNVMLVERAHLPGEDAGLAGARPQVKLLDFGIARQLNDDPLEAAENGMPLGTPLYMSPEQCNGITVDVRADIYSFGVLMFELFTGRLPFRGRNSVEVVRAQMIEEPPRPGQLVAMPPRLEGLILDCLAKDRDLRPSQMREVRDLLVAIREQMEAPAPLQAVGTSTRLTWPPPQPVGDAAALVAATASPADPEMALEPTLVDRAASSAPGRAASAPGEPSWAQQPWTPDAAITLAPPSRRNAAYRPRRSSIGRWVTLGAAATAMSLLVAGLMMLRSDGQPAGRPLEPAAGTPVAAGASQATAGVPVPSEPAAPVPAPTVAAAIEVPPVAPTSAPAALPPATRSMSPAAAPPRRPGRNLRRRRPMAPSPVVAVPAPPAVPVLAVAPAVAPVLSGLRYDRAMAVAGMPLVVSGQFDYRALPGTRLTLLSRVAMPDGQDEELPGQPIAVRGARGLARFTVPILPREPGVYRFHLWVLDGKGQASNHLVGAITVSRPAAVDS